MAIDSSEDQQVDWFHFSLSFIFSLVICYILWLASSNKLRGSMINNKKLKRTWSYSSELFRIGPFPPEDNVPPIVINLAAFFTNCPSETKIVSSVVEPMFQYERLSAAPHSNHQNKEGLENDFEFSPRDMVRTIEICGSDDLLMETLSNHFNDDLRNRPGNLPWWEFLAVRNTGSGYSAVMLRVEHCLGDGISLNEMFENILTDKNGAKLKSSTLSKMMKKTVRKEPSLLAYICDLFKILISPLTPFDSEIMFTKFCSKDVLYSGNRKVILFPNVSLDVCKRLKNKFGCSVNDILLCAVSQAIIDYCESQNCEGIKSKVQCRVIMPHGFPRTEKERNDKSTALGNRSAVVSLPLHINEKDILARLEKIKETTTAMKSSATPYIQMFLQNHVASKLPLRFWQTAVRDTFARHSLIMTNVIGPENVCQFAGEDVVDVHLLGSSSISQAAFISYNGKIHASMVLDHMAIPNCDQIAKFYIRSIDTLCERLEINNTSSDSPD